MLLVVPAALVAMSLVGLEQTPPVPSGRPRGTPPPDSMEALLERLPTRIPELVSGGVRRYENDVNAYYRPAPGTAGVPAPGSAGAPAISLQVAVESFDTDAGAVAGRARSLETTSIGPTSTDTAGGIVRSWWSHGRVTALVGRHVVTVAIVHESARPLLTRVLDALIPQLAAIIPTRPPLPWAVQNVDAVPVYPPHQLLGVIEAVYRDGSAIKGFAFDLNGDGVDDYIVRAGAKLCVDDIPRSLWTAAPGACAYSIWDGATAKRAGSMFGNPIVVRRETTRGMPDIDAYIDLGGDNGTFTSYRFDGTSYAITASRNLSGPAARELLSALGRLQRFQPGR